MFWLPHREMFQHENTQKITLVHDQILAALIMTEIRFQHFFMITPGFCQAYIPTVYTRSNVALVTADTEIELIQKVRAQWPQAGAYLCDHRFNVDERPEKSPYRILLPGSEQAQMFERLFFESQI